MMRDATHLFHLGGPDPCVAMWETRQIQRTIVQYEGGFHGAMASGTEKKCVRCSWPFLMLCKFGLALLAEIGFYKTESSAEWMLSNLHNHIQLFPLSVYDTIDIVK